MGLCLKIAAGLLLLVHVFHLASLQDSTDSPGRTIDKSWLRELAKKTAGSQNATVSEDEAEKDQGHEDMVSRISIGDGMASDVMIPNTQEEKNVARQEKDTNETSTDPSTVTEPPTSSPTTLQTEQPNATISPNTTATTVPTNSSRINGTEAEEEFHSSTTTTSQISTTHLSEQNSTIFPDNSNRTDLQATTLAPGSNATQEPTTKPDEVMRSTNATESTTTTTATTTTKQGTNETSATSSSTPAFPSETTKMSPATTTTAAPITPEIANRTDTDAASGSTSERGLGEDTMNSKRNGVWVAILGLGLTVILIGLVAYVILKKKNRKGFSHRKLVEEYPSDPVLRLDNGTPLDLKFGRDGSAYYNPALQADNIQMKNFQGHR
ncbi:mucin-5AC [Anarrhichthys ocellatus]|uniref:mucin-5AC n=1 Tax=Anarrhichthys ocellatus TaxID=433405 RepID=UPI0012EDB5B2|nr:mucin-5AC-like [Anarrhichthys ocellatus]